MTMFHKIGQLTVRELSSGKNLQLDIGQAGNTWAVGTASTTLGTMIYHLDGCLALLPEVSKPAAAGYGITPHLFVQELGTERGNQNYWGLGRGLLAGAVERSFNSGRSGYVYLYASRGTTSRSKRHAATYYAKVGFQPALSRGSIATYQGRPLGELIDQATLQNKPLGIPQGIYMEIREGLGQAAKEAREAQLKLPPNERDPGAVLETAPEGTKAHRIKEIRQGRALLEEMRGLDKDRLRLLD